MYAVQEKVSGKWQIIKKSKYREEIIDIAQDGIMDGKEMRVLQKTESGVKHIPIESSNVSETINNGIDGVGKFLKDGKINNSKIKPMNMTFMVIGVIGGIIAIYGLTQWGTFVRRIGGADANFYSFFLWFALIDVGLLIARFTGRDYPKVRLTLIVLTFIACFLLAFAPAVPVLYEVWFGMIALLVSLFMMPGNVFKMIRK